MSTRTPVERSQIIRNATPREAYDVVVDFEQYPRLFPEIKRVRIIERTLDHTSKPTSEPTREPTREPTCSRARVEFRADNILPVRYVLDMGLDPAACTVDWSYVEGEVVTDSTGGWRFAVEGDGVRVDYRASVMIQAPLPGFVIRRLTDALVSASLPGMFASVERELRARQSPG